MEVKVFGPGCKTCKKLIRNLDKALLQLKLNATVMHVTDLAELAANGILQTPGLMVNGQIKLSGRLASVSELKKILADAAGLESRV